MIVQRDVAQFVRILKWRCQMKQKIITNVFDSWEETIIWSCLQGIMGDVYTNNAEDAAMAILGDFALLAVSFWGKEKISYKKE